MDASSNLGLPFIVAAQAQKHITHNEALRALDAIVHLMVLDKDLASPPGSPAEGARYIVASSPSGAWSGQAGNIAAYQDGAWAFYAPREGWLAWAADEDKLYVWTGSAWAEFAGGGGGGGGSLDNVVEDTTPQLGGDLDGNGFNIGFDDGTGIEDDSDNEQLIFQKTAGAVNHVEMTNAATGNRPKIAAAGDDTNIDLDIGGKGTGSVRLAEGTGVKLKIANGSAAARALEITGGGSSQSCSASMETDSDSTNPVFEWKDSSPGQARVGAFNYLNGAGNVVGQLAYQFNGTGANQWMRTFVNGAERMRWDGSGNVLIGGTTSPASATKALVLFNGVAPAGSVTDGVALYAEDVSSSSELKVRDEAGNVTTLSPHNFAGIPDGPSEPMAWAFHSERDGRSISVDMLRVVRAVERLSGQKLVHERGVR
jgi:hypothetical protein